MPKSPAPIRDLAATKPNRRTRPRLILTLFCLLAVTFGPGCSCQRQENIDAKNRLSKPPPPDPVLALAQEVLDVRHLEKNPALLKRSSRMRFAEVGHRLQALKYSSQGTFTFTRDQLVFDAKETVEILRTDDGDFTISLVTGDGSTQDLVYANDVFFLKNNNGKWRASRDPVGERSEYLDDSAGAWRMMYDLFAHTLKLEPGESTTWEGRAALRYHFTVTDKGQEAEKLAAQEPSLDGKGLLEADAGIPSASALKKKMNRVQKRVAAWRERARPTGGEGSLIVDRETGVMLSVVFKGQLLVGDAKNPSDLTADLKTEITQIGKAAQVNVPAAATAEVTRKKWPVAPRTLLEKAGLVGPAPKPEKKSKRKPSSSTSKKTTQDAKVAEESAAPAASKPDAP